MLETVLSFACNLDRGIDRTAIRPALLTGDKQAHTFRIAVSRSGAEAALSGAGVSGYFIRADGVTVPITGSASGSIASVTLTDGCYNVPGRFQLVVKLSLSGETSTVFFGDGAVASSRTDAVLDDEDVIPSLDELLAQIAATEAAAAHASSAAATASGAASTADTAASRANAAAASVEGMSARATTLSPGSQATANMATVDGVKVLTIGVPQGVKGDKGDQGDPGDVSSVNGVAPVAGNVTLTAGDVGALPAGGTAADAGLLGGKAPAYYLQPYNWLVNGNFTNPVNSLGVTTMTAGGSAIDRWRFGTSGTATLDVQNGLVRMKADEGSYGNIKQTFADNSALIGKTMTFAACLESGEILCMNMTYGTNKSVSSADGKASLIHFNTNDFYLRVLGTGDEWIGFRWAALYEGTYTADTLPPYVPRDIMLEMLSCGAPLNPHNLLDNSDFRNPVNQRGNTAYTASGYTIDRWAGFKWSSDGSATLNLSVNSSGILLSGGVNDSSTAAACYMYQTIDCTKLAGKTVTAAVSINSLSGSGTGAILAYNGTTYIDRTDLKVGVSLLSFAVPTDATTLTIRIGNDSSHAGKGSISASISWAALYEGTYTADTLPPYVPKGYAAELAECMRYYQRFDASLATLRNYAVCSTSVSVLLPLYTPMRIAPSYCGDTTGRYVRIVGGSTTPTTVTYSSCSASASVVSIILTPETAMANSAGWVDSMTFALSADL
ncbi:MAG: hypothetical protein ACI4PC_10025 [Oscillospiraceae bacterium]